MRVVEAQQGAGGGQSVGGGGEGGEGGGAGEARLLHAAMQQALEEELPNMASVTYLCIVM